MMRFVLPDEWICIVADQPDDQQTDHTQLQSIYDAMVAGQAEALSDCLNAGTAEGGNRNFAAPRMNGGNAH